VEAFRNAWSCARRARQQHFLLAFSSVPAAARTPQRLLQLQPLHQHLLRHLHQLRLHLDNAQIMIQVQVIAAMIVATARMPVAGLVSSVKDLRQVTTVHQIVQVKMKTWPSPAWIGHSAAAR
jgi:hypothetical protein